MVSSSAQDHVLRVARSDKVGEYVLVNVSSDGIKPLDLTIQATEGENPYVGSIKHSRITKQPIRDSKNSFGEHEWEATLRSLLLQQSPLSRQVTNAAGGKENVEIVATVAQESSLTIHVRNNIEGIIQRLGQIDLTCDPEIEIDTISWAHTAVSRADALHADVQNLKAESATRYESAEKLNKQLTDLIAAKKEHEEALLNKFRELLNAKKLKIRDQQRLLAGAKFDPKQASNVQAARSGAEKRGPGDSRKGKRKIDVKDEEEDDSEEDGFAAKGEVMKKADSEDEAAVHAPEATDDEATADEDESDGDMQTGKVTTWPDRSKDMGNNEKMHVDTPPAARDLPSGQNREETAATIQGNNTPETQQEAMSSAPHDDDDETDDEL